MRTYLVNSVKSVFEMLRRRLGTASVVLLCAMLGACATPFKAETTVFHQWPNHTSSSKVFRFVLPSVAEQTLERSAHENVLRQALLAKGFVESPESRTTLSFSYQAREHRQLMGADVFGSISIFGGGGFRRGGFGLGGSFPLGGYPVREAVFQERTLSLVFSAEVGASQTRVYEGKAVALDGGRDALAALPYLVRALLEDFPGPSGVTRQVQLPIVR